MTPESPGSPNPVLPLPLCSIFSSRQLCLGQELPALFSLLPRLPELSEIALSLSQWPRLGPSVLGKMAEKQEEPSTAQNGEPDNAEEGEGKKKKVKREDLPPFEIVTG